MQKSSRKTEPYDIVETETEKAVIKVIKDRWKKGRATYGQGISWDQKKNPFEWIDEAIEEAADMLQYLVAMREQFARRKW